MTEKRIPRESKSHEAKAKGMQMKRDEHEDTKSRGVRWTISFENNFDEFTTNEGKFNELHWFVRMNLVKIFLVGIKYWLSRVLFLK